MLIHVPEGPPLVIDVKGRSIWAGVKTRSIRGSADKPYRSACKNGSLADSKIGLVVERDDGKVLAIEVKLGDSVDPKDVCHLVWLQQQLGDDLIDAMVVYSGRHAFRMGNIAVVPLALLGP